MSLDAPLTPAPAQPPVPKRSNGLRIVLIIGAVLIVCAVVCCAGSLLFGSQIGTQSIAFLCTTKYPDLSQQQCSDWASSMLTQHPQEFTDCQQQSQSESPGYGQMDALFSCLEDKGVGPKN